MKINWEEGKYCNRKNFDFSKPNPSPEENI
jgi:hypothetical protein